MPTDWKEWMESFKFEDISRDIKRFDQLEQTIEEIVARAKSEGWDDDTKNKAIYPYLLGIEKFKNGSLAYKNKNYSEAFSYYSTIVVAFPELKDALVGSCYSLYHMKEFEQTIKLGTLTLEKYPDTEGLRFIVARSFDDMEKYDDAITYFKAEINSFGESAPRLMAIAFSSFKKGVEVVSEMERAMKPYREIYDQTKNYFETSIDYYNKTLKLEPNNKDVIEAKTGAKKMLAKFAEIMK